MKILLIEDELELANSLIAFFKSNNVICEHANDVFSALDKIGSFTYDCVVLDIMLPDGTGFEILKELKKLNKTDGVIMISAKDGLTTRLEGLTLGADDFLIKPFHMSELLVRIQAIVRRKNFDGKTTIQFNEITIDVQSKTTTINDKIIDLTKKELDLLLFLMGNKNQVLSKAAIAEHLSGDMADMLDNHDFIYAHIKNLKKKLTSSGANDYIKTMYGIGYKWQE
jgi:DNA-binding response OmpR family regulator